jgi:hypothetical protein
MRTPLGILLATTLGVGFAAPARATVLAEVPLDRMAHEADAIVLGQVTGRGVRAVVRDNEVSPFTVSTVHVRQWLKGRGGDTVQVYEKGGRLPDRSVVVTGTPQYRPGQHVLVFLEQRPAGQFRTYGMAMGRFALRPAVDGGPIAVQDLSDVGVATWPDGKMRITHPGVRKAPLRQLLARIRQALQNQPSDPRGAPQQPTGGAR